MKQDHRSDVKELWVRVFKKKLILEGREVTDLPAKRKFYKEEQYKAAKRYFQRFDQYLDKALNEPHWLKHPELAKQNLDTLNFYNGKHYNLHAACIMSNHVHVLFTLLPGAPDLDSVMQQVKSYTGTMGNRFLKRHDRFWEIESYDHWLRDGEFERILWYILNNPVKAGLASHWTDWEWSFVHPDLRP